MESYNATKEFINNIKHILFALRDSIFRRGKAVSERAQSQAIFQNLFFHIHPVKVHKNSLKPTYSWGLGVMAFAFFVLCTITGILLMVYYKPSVSQA